MRWFLIWATSHNLEKVFVDHHSCDASLLLRDTLLSEVSPLYNYFHLLNFEDFAVASMVFVKLFGVRMLAVPV